MDYYTQLGIVSLFFYPVNIAVRNNKILNLLDIFLHIGHKTKLVVA